ncbi:hypothetical protein Tco_0354301, partial [Tanacetum coccineum]
MSPGNVARDLSGMKTDLSS